MEILDLKKELKHLYNPPSKAPVLLEVPPMNFLSVDGEGSPDGPAAMQAMEALYPAAYTLKFAAKKSLAVDYAVMPLEGLWWAEDMGSFISGDKRAWKWTYMIMQPDLVTRQMVEQAVEEVRRKKNPAALDKMKFGRFEEGMAAQIMHIGPYSEEGTTVKMLHEFIHQKGLVFDGLRQKHHEIYLSDPRRSAPEKMKTILRQPVVKG